MPNATSWVQPLPEGHRTVVVHRRQGTPPSGCDTPSSLTYLGRVPPLLPQHIQFPHPLTLSPADTIHVTLAILRVNVHHGRHLRKAHPPICLTPGNSCVVVSLPSRNPARCADVLPAVAGGRCSREAPRAHQPPPIHLLPGESCRMALSSLPHACRTTAEPTGHGGLTH